MKYLCSFLLIYGLVFSAGAQEKHKIIFDCDMGDDIDDAFALGMILSSDKFEVLGICMDNANTDDRAVLTCKLLYEIGAEHIPVYVGRKTWDGPTTQHSWGKGFDKLKPQEKGAAEFIVETLNEYPGEVNLITVGPVTNMQDVITIDKNALSKAKHIYAMFGSFYLGYQNTSVISMEFNVRANIEASKIYTTNVKNITYAGLDITNFVYWDNQRMAKMNTHNSPLTNALTELTEIWKLGQNRQIPILFDCVAIGLLLWPDLFETRPAHVKVIGGGYTVIDEGKSPNGKVGLGIKTDEFLDRLMDLYLNQNLSRKE